MRREFTSYLPDCFFRGREQRKDRKGVISTGRVGEITRRSTSGRTKTRGK